MRGRLALKFNDGPFEGLDLVAEFDAGVDTPDTIVVDVSGPTDGKPNACGDEPHWSVTYAVDEFACDTEYSWAELKVVDDRSLGWSPDDGSLVQRPKVDQDTIDAQLRARWERQSS